MSNNEGLTHIKGLMFDRTESEQKLFTETLNSLVAIVEKAEKEKPGIGLLAVGAFGFTLEEKYK